MAAFKEIFGQKISDRIQIGTVHARKEIEQVKSELNGSKGQVLKDSQRPSKKSRMTIVCVKSFQIDGMVSGRTFEAIAADFTGN